jgi:sialic acid synthase SpsE
MTRLYDAEPFIIAEIGSNIQTLDHCLHSIAAAKEAGADAAKFQLFSRSALYGFDGGTDAYSLSLDWLPTLKAKADEVGIEFMCTAFSPELVKEVDPYVSCHKIASSDLSYPQLLEAVGRTGRPVLLSCGASSHDDIRRALEILPESPVLMYCVSSYPARSTNLGTIDILREELCGLVGFSDHSTDIVGLPYEAAMKYGIVALEKHMTAFPELDTPDRPHSLTTDEFSLMVDYIRGRRRPEIGPTWEEVDMLLKHNRRLIATKDIDVGETLVWGVNFGSYRSLEDDERGLSPFLWEGVNGKRAKVAMGRGKAIGLGDF